MSSAFAKIVKVRGDGEYNKNKSVFYVSKQYICIKKVQSIKKKIPNLVQSIVIWAVVWEKFRGLMMVWDYWLGSKILVPERHVLFETWSEEW